MSDQSWNFKKLYIASDHAGLDLKTHLIQKYPDLPWEDLGTDSKDSVDYPDFADKVATKMNEKDSLGVLVCGSGQGMAIRANRYPEVRAALCWNEEIAQLSRQHNNANILCMGARVIEPSVAERTLETFLKTDFEGGRHQRRVDKLTKSPVSGC